jgi:hypothetical protein
MQTTIEKQVRFARKRMGTYEVIDFVAVLIGYALSGEPTIEGYYTHLIPWAQPYMALYGRANLPHRATLSRFLAALDTPAVEVLRECFFAAVVARRVADDGPGGMWDRQGTRWLVFDVDGTRQAARQRALPEREELPPGYRRLELVCAAGYQGRKRGEVVRTRTTILQAHTHQWLGTFAGAGNGDELLQSLHVLVAYLTAMGVATSQGIVRLDGLYGDGAIIADIVRAGLLWLMRGRDYHLLAFPEVQARLEQPADQQTTHPESGICRNLFDFPDLRVTADGPHSRVVVATHPASSHPSPIGVTRDGVVYELFFTGLPTGAFTPTDVLELYSQRGGFECVLADEDTEQNPDRWCSQTPCGQAWWQILAQWVWNLRSELGQVLAREPMRRTELAPAALLSVGSAPTTAPPSEYEPPLWAKAAALGRIAGADFVPHSDGTLRCPTNQPLYPQERRPEHDGSVRIVYAARLASCRPCPVRARCQEHGAATKKPRRVSAVLWPRNVSSSARPTPDPAPLSASYPLLWGDWNRRRSRRDWIRLLRGQQVVVLCSLATLRDSRESSHVWTRAERAHWRLSWSNRLARNARSPSAPPITITLSGIPSPLARYLGLSVA